MLNEIVPARTQDVFSRDYSYTSVESQAKIIKTIQEQNIFGCDQVAVVTVHLVYELAAQVGSFLAERAKQSILYLVENIRPLVRKTDQVFLHEYTISFVLLKATLQGAMIVEERLWEALLWRTHNMDEHELLRPLEMTIGRSAYPEPQAALDELFKEADRVSKHFARCAEKPMRQDSGQLTHKEETPSQETKDELAHLAKKLGIPYLSWLPPKLSPRVSQAINARSAYELRCYPIGRARNMLTVAMLNPQDRVALERLQQETGLCIFPVLTRPEALEVALKQFYAREGENGKGTVPLAADLRYPV